MEEQDFNLINNATKIEKFKNFFFNNIKKINCSYNSNFNFNVFIFFIIRYETKKN